MTSSSNIAGDLKHGLRLRKVNCRYFSFKWKTEYGESALEKSSTIYKSNECTSGNSNDGKNSNGFFKNIKKKLSLKNFYKSRRKIIATETNELEGGSSSLTTDVNERPCSFNLETHNNEIKNRIGEINPDIANPESNELTACSKNQTNDCTTADYLNCGLSNENSENLLINRRNVDNYPETADTETCLNDSQASSSPDRLRPTEKSPAMSTEAQCEDKISPLEEQSIQNSSKESQSSLSQELLRLSKYGWYWGSISGDEADAKLICEPDGAFLIRDSSDHRHLLTLSFKSAGKLLHARVEYSGGMFSLCNQGESGRFSSVPALIDHTMNFSKSAVFCYSRPRHPGYPAFPVRLTKPVSRFSEVRSLQYLCRFVIRQHMRRDNICKLPLPESIKGYVEEGPYY